MDDPHRISFLASLPPIKTAITFDGTGDGGEIRLSVPRTDADALLATQLYFSGRVFRVILEEIAPPLLNKPDQAHDVRQRKQRKSAWAAPE